MHLLLLCMFGIAASSVVDLEPIAGDIESSVVALEPIELIAPDDAQYTRVYSNGVVPASTTLIEPPVATFYRQRFPGLGQIGSIAGGIVGSIIGQGGHGHGSHGHHGAYPHNNYPGQQGGYPGQQGGYPGQQGGYPGQQGGSSCRYWCRSPTNQYYCCEGQNQQIGGGGGNVGTKQGFCPAVRPSCPPTRIHGPPRTCSNDYSCGGRDKCCFDTCLQHHTCKPAQWGIGR